MFTNMARLVLFLHMELGAERTAEAGDTGFGGERA